MAKNTTGSGATIDGVTVVHPDNMGNTLVFKDKVYNVNLVENGGIQQNNDGSLQIGLSKKAGNTLRLIDGELYQGESARPELANLFVDAVNGVDTKPTVENGAGSRAKPLKTVNFAMSLAEVGTNRTIYLREEQDHIVSAGNGEIIIPSGTTNFSLYGDKFDAMAGNFTDGSDHVAGAVKSGIEPKLVFTGYRIYRNNDGSESGHRFSCWLLQDSNIRFDGVSIVNDVGVELSPISGVTVPREWSRITGSGELYTVRNKLFSKGTTTSTIPSVTPTYNGLSLIGFVQGVRLNVNLYKNMNDIERDVKCFIISPNGWNIASDTSTTLNALANSDTNQRAIARRVAGVVKEDIGGGATIVKVPSTSIPYSYFP